MKNFLTTIFVFSVFIFGSIDFDAKADKLKEIPIRLEPEGVEDIVENESADYARQILLMEKYKINLGSEKVDKPFLEDLEEAIRDMMAYCQDGSAEDCRALASVFRGRSKRFVSPNLACQAAGIYGYSCEFYNDKKSCRSFNLLKKNCKEDFK